MFTGYSIFHTTYFSSAGKIGWVLLLIAAFFFLIIGLTLGLILSGITGEEGEADREAGREFEQIWADVDDSFLLYEPAPIPEGDNLYSVWDDLRELEIRPLSSDVLPDSYGAGDHFSIMENAAESSPDPDLLAAAESYVDSNPELMQIIERAASAQNYSYPDLDHLTTEAKAPPYHLIIHLSDVQTAYARALAEKGETEEALVELFKLWDISHNLAMNGPVPAVEVRLSQDIARQVLSVLEEWTAADELPAEVRNDYQEQLDDYRRSAQDARYAYIMEYTLFRESIRFVLEGEPERFFSASVAEEISREELTPDNYDPRQLHNWYFELFEPKYRAAQQGCRTAPPEAPIRWFSEQELESGRDNYLGKALYQFTAVDLTPLMEESCRLDSRLDGLLSVWEEGLQ